MPAATVERADQVRDQVQEAREERDAAYRALAELQSLLPETPEGERYQMAVVLRRFHLDLPTARKRQVDRLITEARVARRAQKEDKDA